MVGEQDSVDAVLARVPRILGRDPALDHESPLPALAYQLDVLPVQLVAQRRCRASGFSRARRAARGVRVLEMRHAVLEHGARRRAEQPARMGQRSQATRGVILIGV